MVAGADSARPRLAGVLAAALDTVQGHPGTLFPPSRRAAVVLVDGLGAAIVKRSGGYLRSLRARASRRMFGSFPSTTAVALTSLCTGRLPAEHGILEYSVYDQEADRARNMLSGWGSRVEAAPWGSAPTLFERAGRQGVAAVAIGAERYRETGFSEITLRGAEYRAAEDPEAAFRELHRFLSESGPGIAYVYLDGVDHAGHRYGAGSPEHLAQLDALDSAVAGFHCPGKSHVLLTADHGMVNVTAQLTLQDIPRAEERIHLVTGEPRMSVLVCEPGEDPGEVCGLLQPALGPAFEVIPTGELWKSGLLGVPADSGWMRRLGDLCVVAVDDHSAFYDRRTASPGSFQMRGQHGGASSAELEVPLVQL
ncbi:MAG: alkaline phosphatase family protein [Microbacteriaceae bacterium]|nr:alkaline phosphatase family protein [Microbacteriaceae bacterium]MCI1207268.1 alkaline phosphatase family protein [Microbacteriaceae bacterium]